MALQVTDADAYIGRKTLGYRSDGSRMMFASVPNPCPTSVSFNASRAWNAHRAARGCGCSRCSARTHIGRAVRRRRCISPLRDAGEASILPRDADASMAHHEHQEARLTLGEPEFDNGLDAVLDRHHYQNSSAKPRVRPARPPPPLRPPMRTLIPP